jgi:ATP-dependent DNA helicase RecG
MINQSVTKIRGVGQKKSEKLKEIGIETIHDLLLFFPRDYSEYGKPKPIKACQIGEIVAVKGFIVGSMQTIATRKRLRITKAKLNDGVDELTCVWYNQPYISKQLQREQAYVMIGKIEKNNGKISMDQPVIEVYQPDVHEKTRIQPIYHTTKGISQKEMRKMLNEIFQNISDIDIEINVLDPFPTPQMEELGFNTRAETIRQLHQPLTFQALGQAVRRNQFEDFFWFRSMIELVREGDDREKYVEKMAGNVSWFSEFEQSLPFNLTNSQKLVIGEIDHDLQKGRVMNRLVHGDVGSGKTMVALAASIQTVKNGGQVAIVAPTEVLANQHFQTMQPFLQQLGYQIALLTGSVSAKTKKDIKYAVEAGDIRVVIGTHALFQDDVCFKHLRLVVTDEQHRFGVKQRAFLKSRGEGVHYLVMSATPIPRTIALVAYGDLDISVLNEKPKNRKPIKTYRITSEKRQRAYGFIKQCVEKGEQAYIICPLVEENELIHCQSAVELQDSLKRDWLKGLKVGLLHGKLKADEKNNVIQQFELGKIDVLVSTTVVEVGVDVPNATAMIIENAERFGLAQLHQLRGRVGRNGKQAYCVLVSDAVSQQTQKRLAFLTHSSDGFEIAEHDLKLRGPGDFIGIRQHGVPMIDVEDMINENDLFESAGKLASEFLKNRKNGAYQKLDQEVNRRLESIQTEIIMN